jgi:hypothetical protein
MVKAKTKMVRATPATIAVLRLMANKTGRPMHKVLEALVLPCNPPEEKKSDSKKK